MPNEKPDLSVDAPGVALAVVDRIKEDIDDYCIKTYDDGFRWHLGGSMIGHECKKYLWLSFRWAFLEDYNGATPREKKKNHARMQRLFQRGHLEEFRFVEYLRGIGWEIHEFDTSKPTKPDGTFPQFRISAVGGHFGGSLDGIGIPPARYRLGRKPFLLEFKTKGTGAGFNKLVEKGVVVSNLQHFAQMSTYGAAPEYNLDFALYNAVNKNDDDLHVEIVKLDHKLGAQMRWKAEQVITSQTAPARISDNPTFFQCKFCPAFDECHNGKTPPKNCRSCKFARPVEGGEWVCGKVDQIIPRDFVPQGCNEWRSITSNV